MNASFPAITFDIDWAPDWAIADCVELCARNNVPATFFATHDSAVNREIECDRRFELGIHPNFLPGTTQGHSVPDILHYCLDLAPSARSMRTHGLFQSSRLFADIRMHARQIDVDVSLYLHRHSGLRPIVWRLDRDAAPLVRLPYFWEDDFAAADPDWTWSEPMNATSGLAIYDFHPILVALNIASLANYQVLKSKLGRRPMRELARDDVAAIANKERGNRDFLNDLLCSGVRFSRVSDIADAACKTLALQ